MVWLRSREPTKREKKKPRVRSTRLPPLVLSANHVTRVQGKDNVSLARLIQKGGKRRRDQPLVSKIFFFFFQKGSFLVDYVFSVVSDSLSSAVVSHRLCVKKKWQPIRAWRAVAVTSEGYANVVPLSLVIQLVKFVSICHAKTNKPLMEKRRRARINHSLSVLKSLIIKDEVGLVTHTPFLDIIL